MPVSGAHGSHQLVSPADNKKLRGNQQKRMTILESAQNVGSETAVKTEKLEVLKILLTSVIT